jgi:LacI family transcriptional regulator
MGTSVTIADVAREANVSTQTVSRAINNKGEISPETRQRVLEVIERLGYRPNSIARGLATNRTLTLGLVVPDIANPFFPEVARAAEDLALEHGYNMFLCNTIEDPDREAAVLGLLEDKRVDGVILCASRLPDERLLPLLRRHKAVVLVNRPAPTEVAGIVRLDDVEGARRVVRHLLASGRGTLGLLAGPATAYSGQARARGFNAALADAGREHDPRRARQCPPYLEGGYQAALDLLAAHPEIDGLVCYNDLVAIGALQACRELGRDVPRDIAIVGCDDILLAGLVSPALTTLRVSKSMIGARAVQMLLDRIHGREAQAEVVFTPELVVRASAP